ncbi:hypothetical protein ACQCX2_12965 [Propionibacteriaceae bacterium Y1700]|uniref:hypothetical protein n=1 Tax=Microlunatus sp. Y1700 TaxID=3418487 RepID=UPI003DA7A5D8
MRAVGDVLGEAGGLITDLVVGTVRTTAAHWPQLLGLAMIGWLVPELALKAAILLPTEWPYLVLAVFAFGFLGTLVCTVLMIRLATTHVARHRGDEVRSRDRRGTTQLLASTLLPFLGVYAAFNHVHDRAREMTNQATARSGVFEDSLISNLDPFTSTHKMIMVLLLIIGTYVVRRLVDLLHDRTGWRPLGFAVVVLESYFLLVVILSGQQFVERAIDWWQGRRLQQWLDQAWQGLGDSVRGLGIDLPVLVVDLSTAFFAVVWPVLIEVLTEPIVWLAIAALVMGSPMLGLSDVVRVGRRPRRHTSAGGRSRLAYGWREFRTAFLGDVDDKYLPTINALSMVLRAGLVLLGAYVLIWTVLRSLGHLWEKLIFELVGGHRYIGFWVVNQPWVELVTTVPVEVLRAALLGVAFTLCTERLAHTLARPDNDDHDRSGHPKAVANR